MAKSKAKSKDHDEELPEEIKEAADEVVEDADVDELEDADVDEVEDVDAEPVEDIEDVEDVDAAVADEEDLDDVKAKATDDDDDGPHDSVDDAPKPPRPRAKLTKTTIALILLNWVMAPAFLYAVWMDYRVRMEYAYRTVLNYVQMIGLPLRQEEDNASLATDTRPPIRLSREMITADYTKRPGVNKSIKDFAAVDEPIPFRLRPSDMDETMMKDVFRDLPNPVRTLEEEIERLKTALPKQIADAADEVLKKQKDDAEKRALVQKTLYPIIGDTRWKGPPDKDTPLYTWEIDKVNDRLQKATGAELDDMVKDAVQRRIYWDILAPLNVQKQGDVTTAQIEKMGDLTVPIDDLKKYLVDRLSAAIAETYDTSVYIGSKFDKNVKSDSVEKRHRIAYILFTLGQIEKPGLNEKLIKKGVERAQTISGLYEFTNATIDFVKAVRVLDERLAYAIKDDRSGVTYKTDKGTITHNEGFIDLYEAEIDRLVRLVASLETAQKRLADLNVDKGKLQKTHDQRAEHYKKTMEKLREERDKTAKYMKDLRALQAQLHEALVELSNAATTNLRILGEITAIESDYIRKNAPKGGKK